MPSTDRRIRAVDDDAWKLFRLQALARGLTLAQWFARLVQAQEQQQ